MSRRVAGSLLDSPYTPPTKGPGARSLLPGALRMVRRCRRVGLDVQSLKVVMRGRDTLGSIECGADALCSLVRGIEQTLGLMCVLLSGHLVLVVGLVLYARRPAGR